jgi:hypothetical protein
MHAHDRIDIRVTLGDCDGLAIGLNRFNRPDRNYQAHSGCPRALEDRGKVAAQLGVGEMTMRID